MAVWPGDPAVVLERYQAIRDGDAANVSRLSCGVHVGTHVDAPLHFVEGGASVERLPLDALLGPAWIAEVRDASAIEPRHLEASAIPPGTERLLLKTRNSSYWAEPETFHPDFAALTTAAAQWVVQRRIRLVGVDYLSVQLFDDAEPDTHRTLLGAGVVIVEGLDLRGIDSGPYELCCLPLKLVGSDGAPARVLLARD